MHRYHAYGLRIHSDVALPFVPCPTPPASAPDVVVRLGIVPVTLPGGLGNLTRTPLWQARTGAFLMHIEGVVRYLVTGGRHVLIEPFGGDDACIADVVAGSVFTFVLQQRGVVTLHAAAVATEAGALLLCGPGGIGKSSLAAALVERGYPLLSDNVAGVVRDVGGRAIALPAFPRQRLSAHVVDEMHWRDRVQPRVRQEMEKYWIPAQRACAVPLLVRAAFVLTASDRPDIGTEPVPPGRAFWLLWNNTHRRRAMGAMGQRHAHFRALTEMARHVPVALVRRPRSPFLLDALADHIDALLREAGPAAGSISIPCPRLRAPRR